MMKKLFLPLLLVLTLPLRMMAQDKIYVTVNLTTAGTLQEVLMDSEHDRIDGLTITGKFNSVDLIYLQNRTGRLANLEFLDLTDIEIVECDEYYYSWSEPKSSIGGYGNPPVHLYYLSPTEYTTSETTGNLASKQTRYYHHTPNLDYAFYKNGGQYLKEICLPKGNMKVGEYICSQNSYLERIVLPENCEEVGNCAFQGCTALTNIVNTEKVHSVGASAFSSTKINAKFAPLKYIGGEYTFYETSIKSISFADELELIPDNAFSNCRKLEELDIPGSVKTIGANAFENCYGLTRVTIGEGTTTLGEFAFADCTRASDFTLPSTVISIGRWAFDNVPLNFDIEEGVTYIGKVAYNVTTATTDIVIREGTIAIRDDFGATNRSAGHNGASWATSLKLPSTLKSIGAYAFYGAQLTSLSLPEGLEYIGEGAFRENKQLSSITIPSSLKKTNDANSAFGYCSGLLRVNWNAVDAETGACFYGCDGIEQVVFGEGVKRVPEWFCYELKGLVRIQLSSTIEEFGKDAFAGCTALKTIIWPEVSSLKTLGMSCFYGCKSLTAITLPKSVEVIDEYVFPASGLETLTLAEGSQLKEIGDLAFSKLTTLKSINLEASTAPEGITIGSQSFEECTGLTSISLANVIKVGEKSFNLCKNLAEVKIPSDAPLEEIGQDAFYLCKALTAINFPDGIKKIGSSSFYNTSITTVVLPAGLESVEAFLYNTPLKDAYVLFKDAEVLKGIYYDNHSSAVLHVPYGTKDKFWSMSNIKRNFESCVEFGAPSESKPIEENTNVDLSKLAGEDLSNAVVDGIYYAVETENGDGYDATEGCLVLNSTMTAEEMEHIFESNGNDQSLVANYKGIVMQLTAGEGKIAIDGQTAGTSQLMVKIGNAEPVAISISSRDKKEIAYQLDANARAYIYAATASAATSRAAATENSVKFYGMSVQLSNGVLQGDANQDGSVNVTDIVATVNYIMENPTGTFDKVAADVNEDGYINVTDIVGMVNIIMSSGSRMDQQEIMAILKEYGFIFKGER